MSTRGAPLTFFVYLPLPSRLSRPPPQAASIKPPYPRTSAGHSKTDMKTHDFNDVLCFESVNANVVDAPRK